MTATERALNDTMKHVKALNASDSYRVLGRRFNVPFSTLRDIACGRFEHVSWDTLLLVRMRLGMPDLPPTHTVDGCPTCGGVHIAGDCHGRPVAAVVTLAPGEVVTRNGHGPKPSKPDDRATLHIPKDLARRINALRGKLTQAEYIHLLMDTIEEDSNE